ncbi:hypothetical protein [Sphingobium sp.]|uniref:hypothetical protein n=1 Tax=Sphingobium sp. TaxID=1912891 RepID=UPI0025DB1D93|nr:hypothetical protein [Sphingobium sp.]
MPTISIRGQYATAVDPLGLLVTVLVAHAALKNATGDQLNGRAKASYLGAKKNLLATVPGSLPPRRDQIGQRSSTLSREGDSYYYIHTEPMRLPVWRAVLADDPATWHHIDATSGALLRTVDGATRAERWLCNAPHSFDSPGFNQGSLRSLAWTGVRMGWRKFARDFRRSRWRFSLTRSRS